MVVATATIALQGQLVANDIPRTSRGLGQDVQAVILKGRSNYLCKQRLNELTDVDRVEQQQLLGGMNPSDHLENIRTWADSTVTGDKEELDPSPPARVWQAVSVGPDECPGAARCPVGSECFAEHARQRAHDADIIVTNHHYYGLHLATDSGLLPEHRAVVFDEAHHLPEVLGATCGTEIGGTRFRTLSRRARSLFTDTALADGLEKTANDLDHALRAHNGKQVTLGPDLVALLVSGRERSDGLLSELRRVKGDSEDASSSDSTTKARIERATIMATSVVNAIDQVINAGESDVLWVDGTDNNPLLRRTPLDVGSICSDLLFPDKAVIMTSATLPRDLPSQLGLELDHSIQRVESPFDYQDLALLYCPTHLPEPRSPQAGEALQSELRDLIVAAGGRTLALFTSYRAMTAAADALEGALDVPVLVQGELSKARLLEKFAADPQTVLLATMSFWQGVDIPGSSLHLVTIDRLPFPRPDDPVLQARRGRLGPSAFREVDLPKAQTLLAQAAGRLIRRNDDRGVVAVLDSRLATNRSYRWDLIDALPPFRRTKDKQEVLDFLADLDAGAMKNDSGRVDESE